MNNLYRMTAFPKTINGGNKAGVYLNADNLSEAEMQAIAKNVGYSETAFVLKSNKADFKVRFFTPVSEVNLCGHATIATFNLLRDLKIIEPGIYTQETKAGILRLNVLKDQVFMEQNLPVFGDYIQKTELENCFDKILFHEKLKPQIVSTGLKELFLPVKSSDVLDGLKPHFEKIKQLSEKHGIVGIHAFSLDGETDAYARNFLPIFGILEESATGTASGALSCYLFKYYSQKKSYIFRQGYFMKQPSEIKTSLDIENGEITGVWVGGTARVL